MSFGGEWTKDMLEVLDDTMKNAVYDPRGVHYQLNTFGAMFAHRFEWSGDVTDLNKSIKVLELGVRFTPESHPDKAAWTRNLGDLLWRRFQRLGDVVDLDKSILFLQDAVGLTPDDHPDKAEWLNSLADSLRCRFQRLGDVADLVKSIEFLEDAVKMTADSHPERASFYDGLGNALLTRFKHLGNISDLHKSIEHSEHAVNLTHFNDPDRAAWLNSLGNSLLVRFKQLRNVADLDRAIENFNSAANLTRDDHPSKLSILNNVGISLNNRFQRFGNIDDLNKAISVLDQAIKLTPDRHTSKAARLTNLGSSFLLRFKRIGGVDDLEKSCVCFEEAVKLTSDGHTDRASRLNNLGDSLVHRFTWRSDIGDLNRSIELFGDVMKVTTDGHPHKASRLNNLANSHLRRFEHLGDIHDLDQCIELYQTAVNQIPNGHRDQGTMYNSFGISLRHRFDRLGEVSDINKAIEVLTQASEFFADDHPKKGSAFNNLGASHLRRYRRLEHFSDLEMSISYLEVALKHLPDGDRDKVSRLHNLGTALYRKSQRLQDSNDLDRAIEIFRDALKLTSDNDPDRASIANSLGNSQFRRFKQLGDTSDLVASLSLHSLAAKNTAAPPQTRFSGARSWIEHTITHAPEHAAEACRVGMELMPHLVWLGTSITDWHYRIESAGEITRSAAGVAIVGKKYDTALEWLEQGRSIAWNRLLQLRSPVDDLRHQHPHLASQLELLSSQIAASSDSDTNSLNSRHRIAQQHEELLGHIRSLEGFDRFLLPKPLSGLAPASNEGPVVVLTISPSGAHALVLHRNTESILHVALPQVTTSRVSRWRSNLQSTLSRRLPTWSSSTRLMDTVVNPSEMRYTIVHLPETEYDTQCAQVLAQLWTDIAQPVLGALGITETQSGTRNVRRVWWCPTGPLTFLPIHAAGIYPSGPTLPDFVVSSYTPTISALLNAKLAKPVALSRILTVSLPTEAGLPGTRQEIRSVLEHLQSKAQKVIVTDLCESRATPQSVAETMETSEWAHFACHGRQEIKQPTESCLLLANGSKLTLSDIIGLRLENAQLAFLSACQTAAGDRILDDEAIHLAAGMLLAGYRGVIATMHSVDDQYAADIADDTYRRLFEDYGADPTRAAEALHYAVQKVRKEREAKGQYSFSWVPFVHIGV